MAELQPATLDQCCQDGRGRALRGEACSALPLVSASQDRPGAVLRPRGLGPPMFYRRCRGEGAGVLRTAAVQRGTLGNHILKGGFYLGNHGLKGGFYLGNHGLKGGFYLGYHVLKGGFYLGNHGLKGGFYLGTTAMNHGHKGGFCLGNHSLKGGFYLGTTVSKMCCDCCVLGLSLSSRGLACELGLSLGNRCEQAAAACCDQNVATATNTHPTAQAPALETPSTTTEPHKESYSCRGLDQMCVNTDGSFRCQRASSCGPGYQTTARSDCHDINECVVNSSPCPRGQTCVNALGSYTCRQNTVACVVRQVKPLVGPRAVALEVGMNYVRMGVVSHRNIVVIHVFVSEFWF
ncbi:hypothetical protein CRUP_032515 [Coryphaenoides rupestris]|nr:hypothetical protein CRUP_032515 [Coryphaenoides rupestris]